MFSRLLRGLEALDWEERMLNGFALLAALCTFLPWASGEIGVENVRYTGFGYYTGILGSVIFLIEIGIVLITLIPLVGGPVFIRKRQREYVRFSLALEGTILLLAALSVLTNVSLDSRMEVRFGIYFAFFASLVVLVYAFLRLQEFRKSQVQELFHHPEDQMRPDEGRDIVLPPPPPPPPPAPEPEEHRLYP